MDAIKFAEKLGALDQKARAAHARIDNLDDEVKALCVEIRNELKGLNAYVNESKGWIKASRLIGGALGGLIGGILVHFLGKLF